MRMSCNITIRISIRRHSVGRPTSGSKVVFVSRDDGAWRPGNPLECINNKLKANTTAILYNKNS